MSQTIDYERNYMFFRYSRFMLLVLYCVLTFSTGNAANEKLTVLPWVKSEVFISLSVAGVFFGLFVMDNYPNYVAMKQIYDGHRNTKRLARAEIQENDKEIVKFDAVITGRQESVACKMASDRFNLMCPDVENVVQDFCVDPQFSPFSSIELHDTKTQLIRLNAIERKKIKDANVGILSIGKKCAWSVGKELVPALILGGLYARALQKTRDGTSVLTEQMSQDIAEMSSRIKNMKLTMSGFEGALARLENRM